jgi:hypothetical protein
MSINWKQRKPKTPLEELAATYVDHRTQLKELAAAFSRASGECLGVLPPLRHGWTCSWCSEPAEFITVVDDPSVVRMTYCRACTEDALTEAEHREH